MLYTIALELGLKSVATKQYQSPGPHWVQTRNLGLISIMLWSTWASTEIGGGSSVGGDDLKIQQKSCLSFAFLYPSIQYSAWNIVGI